MKQDIEQRIARINEANYAIAQLDKKIAPLAKRRGIYAGLVQKLESEIRMIQADHMTRALDEERIPYYLNHENIRHDMDNVSKFFTDLGLYTSGKNEETGQILVQICMNEDKSNLAQAKASIELLEPYVKESGRYKWFKILRKSTMNREEYYLKKKVDMWHVVETDGYNETYLAGAISLENVLDYVAENLYRNPIETTSGENE